MTDRLATGVDRRTVLRGACLGCAGLALAACGGSSSSAPAAATPEPDTSSPAAGGTTKPLAALADLTIGQAVAAKAADGRNLLLTRTSQTEVVAFSAICTHQGCTVEPDGAKLACPCHGSVYDARTAKVLSGPAPAPLHSVAVKVQDGQVVLA
jgi:Rieske Fe-S protein